jgi:hypothetical protein
MVHGGVQECLAAGAKAVGEKSTTLPSIVRRSAQLPQHLRLT